MAEIAISLVKTDKEPKPYKRTLSELPKIVKTNREPKIVKKKDEEKEDSEKKVRAGKMQMSLNLEGKPKIMKNGNQVI